MANRTLQLFALGAALVGAVCLSARGGIADAAGPTVAVSPASASAVTGASLTIQFTAAGVAAPGLGGYTLAVVWDPAVLELTSFTDTGVAESGQTIVYCLAPTIDNTAGHADLECAPIPVFGKPGVTVSSPTAIADAVFTAKAVGGSTTLDITGSYLVSNSGAQLATTLVNGSVTVAAPTSTPVPATATPAATGTPEPSATAGATDTATNSPVAAATSTIVPGSTNAAGATLSNVEAPRTGSGDGSSGPSRFTWWIAGIAALAIATLAGGAATYGWRRIRRGAPDGGTGRQGTD